MRRRATATSTSTRAPTSTPPSASSSTPRRSAPACATRPRRCSSTWTRRPPSCRARSPRRARAASSCASTAAAPPPRARPPQARSHAAPGEDLAGTLGDAAEEDWDPEFLALVLAVKVVDSVEEAIEHINTHGSGHSEAILTNDVAAARAFEKGVDAACVYINASTRFTDGGEFGFGAEIGNSTQKLHARGPIGLRELCSFKYVVRGDGHVRA